MNHEHISIRITQLESILTNHQNEHDPEELASMEEELFQLRHIGNLWDEFGDTPMNPETECLEQKWHNFPVGTHREIIWHWFENQFDLSVAENLMGF